MLLLEHSQSSPRGRSGWLPCSALFALTLSLFACDTPPLYPMVPGIGVMAGAGTGSSIPDMFTAADGQPCTDDGECESGHCNHQICCASGDCCLTETDCAADDGQAAVCDDESKCQGTRGEVMCRNFRCRVRDGVEDDSACNDTVEADDCGAYIAVMCTGEATQDRPTCVDSCTDDSQCDEEAHCAEGKCVEDFQPGDKCMASNECSTNYCNRGVCCAGGDCCREDIDCDPAVYTTSAVCQDASTCQGMAGRPACQASQCVTTMVEDDSGCDRTAVANDCGEGADVRCRGGAEQGPPPPCATGTCGGFLMAASCNDEAFCWQGDCLPDQPNGEGCENADACQSGHCSNNVCCDEGGDCCENDSQCPPLPDCHDLVTCQGTRQDRFCDTRAGTCANGMVAEDDTGCGMMMSTKDCGQNLQPLCTAAEEQEDAPPCVRCTNLPRCTRYNPPVCTGEDENRSCTGGDCANWVYDIPVGCVPGARCNSLSGECY
jgi:hypothetical protein